MRTAYAKASDGPVEAAAITDNVDATQHSVDALIHVGKKWDNKFSGKANTILVLRTTMSEMEKVASQKYESNRNRKNNL